MTPPTDPSSAATGERGAPRARVVIIDDDPLMVRLLGLMLQRQGDFDIASESRPQVALEHLPELVGTADAVVLDINMPGADGMEFFRHLAAMGYSGCVALFSGEAPAVLESTLQLARSHGLHVAGALCKPPRVDELQQLVRACSHGTAPVRQPAAAWLPDESELRRAIAAGEIVCAYQPKVALASGLLAGVEALARWRHPQRGLVSPGSFIPLAEASGAIGELTRSVFEQAFAQLAAWRAQGLQLSMSVNASAHDLCDLQFAEFVSDCAQRHRVLPEWVVVEVTESGLGGDPRLLVEVMSRLRLRRFALSIDDFGNGYSTLSKLRDVVFDEIKIDHGFTHAAHESLRHEAIFDTSVALGTRLGMRVVAEGVEDRLDWEFCRNHGVELAQGYFIGRPIDGAELPAWRERWLQRLGEQKLALGA